MVTMKQQMKEDSDNPGKQHDDDGAINDDAKEDGLGGNEYFSGFEENEVVISKADDSYINASNKLTGSRNDFSQLLMGEDWYQYPGNNNYD